MRYLLTVTDHPELKEKATNFTTEGDMLYWHFFVLTNS